MSVHARYLLWFKELSKTRDFLRPGAHVLDIGTSHLLYITEQEVYDFVTHFNPALARDRTFRTYCRQIALSSVVDPAIRTTLVGEVIQKAGLNYRSIDIFENDFCHSVMFDVNRYALAEEDYQVYDLVMNFGTTEHIFNQWNSFKVIHELTKVGGYMFHQLPSIGFYDHGFFNYNPKLFEALQAGNDYEVASIGYSDPQGGCSFHDKYPNFENHALWKDLKLNNGLLNVLFRKTSDRPFSVQLEISTTAGVVEDSISKSYQRNGANVAEDVEIVGPSVSTPQPGKPYSKRVHDCSGWELQRELVLRCIKKVRRLVSACLG